MQESLNGLSKGMKLTVPYPEFFQIITPDLQTVPMPNLANAVGQQSIEALIQDTKLIVMDNLATLCRNGRENESDFWMPVQSGQLDLRRRGLSVLIVHHAGKSGDQRGTPAKEDIMDTVISLKRPKGYTMQKGARFEVHLTKARGVAGEEVRPFEAQLQDDNGTLSWTKRDIEDAELGQLKKHLANGLPIREIAEEMGKSKSAIHRLKNKI
jgi:putative DNA primase/helicase